jgi:hypothetical protein
MTSPRPTHLIAAVLSGLAAGVLGWRWDAMDPGMRGVLVGLLVTLAVLAILARRMPARPPVDSRASLIERVVADETRRPWNPTTLPWLPTGPSTKPLLLIPAADYHLAEIVPLARELHNLDVPTRLAIGESPWERTWPGLAWYPDLDIYELPEPDTLAGQVSAVVVMKDTGSLGLFVQRCRELGIPTIGKVEGAQDFWDADTPEERLPYRNLDLVLCQGQFDADALADRTTAIVGSTRLERLWWAPPSTAAEPLAVINLNFVYGVKTADRKLWLDTAIDGCESAGIPYIISVHPAEKSTIHHEHVTGISASRLLPHATVLISRFSTVPYEAMARGVPFIYHNPHEEKVRTFADPMGGFVVTTDTPSMSYQLMEADLPGKGQREKIAGFFRRHVETLPSPASETRSAEVLLATLGQ